MLRGLRCVLYLARPTTRLRRLLSALAIMLLAACAAAQQCTPEAEPNDTPALATVLTGEGPDAVAASARGVLGTVCLVGELTNGDQDAFLWVVDEAASAHEWAIEVEGPRGGLTQLDLIDVEFAENGVDVTRADVRFRVGTPDGTWVTSDPLLVEPGRYLIGVSGAGTAGQYVANLKPVALADRSSLHREGRAFDAEFAVHAPLEGGFEVPFTIREANAGFVWGLVLRAPVGTSPVATLQGPEGELGSIRVDDGLPARLSSLGLAPGDYVVDVSPGSEDESGYALVRLERQGRVADGVEVEPNDRWEEPTVLPLGGEVRGIADGTDHFRVDVTADEAGSAWDLHLDSTAQVRLRIYGDDEKLIQERNGVSGTSPGLHLAEGTYMVVVVGRDDARYTLSLSPTQPAKEGFEREPNDMVAGATPLGPDAQARGDLAAQDADFFRLDVTSEAQRYRLQVVGEGVEELALYDAGGSRQASVVGQRRIRLDDIVLMPGSHYVRVAGAPGEYALRALSLGPALEPAPPEDAAAVDEPLRAAPEVAADVETIADAVVAPEAAALPTLPPPPPGVLEREPNDDSSRAHRLDPGAVHVGRLASEGDEDRYRFHLPTSQYVRLELQPASQETEWRLVVDGTSYYALPGPAETRVVAEGWLLAGDHEVRLNGSWLSETPSGYYQIRLALLGTLGLPVDLEPNDSPETASTLPAELSWSGRVGDARDRDVYQLPVFGEETAMTLSGRGGEQISFDVLSGGRGVRFEEAEDGSLVGTLAGGEQAYLRVSGQGEYFTQLSFSSPPDRASLLPPREGDEIAAELVLGAEEVAAYWHAGQRVEGTLTLRNRGENDLVTSLAWAVDVPGAIVDIQETATVPAGGAIDLPVSVYMPADVPDQAPFGLQIEAGGGSSAAVVSRDLGLRCEAAPVDPFPYWSVPQGLLGRPNVLFSGFGAVVAEGVEAHGRDALVNDGRTTVSGGGWVGASHAATFRLAGDEAVTLIGTVLNPASDAPSESQLRRFRVETSLDGETFETVFEGELTASKVDQSFVFDPPVRARFARLVGVDSQRGLDEGYFGEWKLIAGAPALFSELDLATPWLGGQVVWSRPLLGAADLDDILAGDGSISRLDLQGFDGYTFVVGFENGRAARVSSISLTQPEAEAEQLFGSVEVSVSMSGAAGPWEPLVAAVLGTSAQATDIALESPMWARYLRFTFPKREGGRHYHSPRHLAVLEAAAEDGYLSVLSEWGTDTTAGPFEHLVGREATGSTEDPDAGDTAQDATALGAGSAVIGTVAVAEDVDWYEITVPPGDNQLEVTLTGDPSIAYLYDLTAPDGSPVPAVVTEQGNEVVLTSFVEPGDYLLRLEEPKRTVIFAWDTSGSVSPYQAITYSSLASFARGVEAERESVQLLAFNEPAPVWLLPYFSSDTERVQRAITEWDRNADSSNSELALLTATKALAGREGTKAILFMTDAESGGHDLTAELWDALGEVRPRVFTFEISSGGNEQPQQLMQSWAGVNAGVYQMARGVGDFDAGFARASCLLRRPKRYSVRVTTAAVEPPGPGTLTVTQADGASRGVVEVIFDASGSMGQSLPSGESRIDAAIRALETLVAEVLPDDTPFALRAFGHVAPSSCETRLDVPLGVLDREAALAAVRAIEPKLLSQTAIADSLALVADDLAGASGPRTVILITDGEESCGGDPAAAARELRASGDVAIAIVSLGLEPESLVVFEDLAEAVGASYVDVTSYEALSQAITEALVPTFEVYDSAGTVVATGRLGGTVELPMGTYSVRVLSSPIEAFEGVRVPGDGSVRVVVGAR